MPPVINIADYRSIVVLTGAGVSAASGLKTYRGPGGIWNEHDVERLGTAKAYETEPLAAWALLGGMRPSVAAAQPNAAHLTLAALEAHASRPGVPAGHSERGRATPTCGLEKDGRVARQPSQVKVLVHQLLARAVRGRLPP